MCEKKPIRCCVCNAESNNIDAAEEGWAAYVWSPVLGRECGPACVVCIEKGAVEFDENAEGTLTEQFDPPDFAQ